MMVSHRLFIHKNGKHIELDIDLARPSGQECAGSPEHRFPFATIYSFLRIPERSRATRFNFDEMNDTLFACNNIDLAPAMTPVLKQNLKTLHGQPASRQHFTPFPCLVMPCHNKDFGKKVSQFVYPTVKPGVYPGI